MSEENIVTNYLDQLEERNQRNVKPHLDLVAEKIASGRNMDRAIYEAWYSDTDMLTESELRNRHKAIRAFMRFSDIKLAPMAGVVGSRKQGEYESLVSEYIGNKIYEGVIPVKKGVIALLIADGWSAQEIASAELKSLKVSDEFVRLSLSMWEGTQAELLRTWVDLRNSLASTKTRKRLSLGTHWADTSWLVPGRSGKQITRSAIWRIQQELNELQAQTAI